MSDEISFASTNESADSLTADEIRLRRQKIMALLKGRWHWAILSSLLLSSILGYLAYKSVGAIYRSTGIVQIDDESILSDPRRTGSMVGNGMERWTSFLRVQDEMIKSEAVAQRALLSDDWRNRSNQEIVYDPKEFSRQIETSMDPSNPKNNLLEISFDSPDPNTSDAAARALVKAYSQEYIAQAKNNYSTRVAQLRSEIQKSDRAIETQMARRRTILSDTEHDQLAQRFKSTLDRKLEISERLDDVRAILASRNPVRNGLRPSPAEMMNADETLRRLSDEKKELEQAVQIRAASGAGPNHLMRKRLETQLNLINSQIEERLGMLTGDDATDLDLDPEYAEMNRLEQQLSRTLAEVSNELESLGEKQRQILNITADITAKQNIIDRARKALEEINLEIAGVSSNFTINRFGTLDEKPFNAGKTKQMAALGALGGILLGTGGVMLIGLLDRRLRHVGDAQLGLGKETRMLGILPTLPDNFAEPEQSERAAHSVHHIRTLLQISDGGRARVFSITSPAAGSGKSSLAVALGLSFAASESKTLVIDCDLVGAGLTRRVGAVVNRSVESILRDDTVLTDEQILDANRASREQGISVKDALVQLGYLTKKDLARLNRRQADSSLGVLDACQGRPFSECVANIGVDNFYVLPIGAAKPQDAGLLSPKALRKLIARAREEYDVVLIDTGPCLGSLEASMAAAEVDATVLIVSRGDSKTLATRARDHLVSVGAYVAGVVFNHALDTDLNQSSFASIVSADRRADIDEVAANTDPEVAARFGPLGSAVAAFGRPSKSPNGTPRHSPEPAVRRAR